MNITNELNTTKHKMLSFDELKKNLKKPVDQFKVLKVALLGDSATQFTIQAIKGYALEYGLNLEIFDAPYNQIEQQIINSSSDLYSFNPSIIIIARSHLKLLNNFYKSSKLEKETFADSHIKELEFLISQIKRFLSCTIVYSSFPEVNDGVFGNYGNKISFSYIYQIRKLNFELMKLSERNPSFFINDIAALYSRYGQDFCHTPSFYVTSDVLHSFDFLPFLAKNIIDIIRSVNGKICKCIILDLDNTLWGGIIGDDGMENIQLGDLGIGKAFTNFQHWIKQLKERGIIIAVCSKNNEDTAKEPFRSHPDMVLKLEDIAIFFANWENKAENIYRIQKSLNIGFDSMVFIDDSQFERNMVRNNIPEIIVPELPEDPAEYLNYLQSLNLFETASFTNEDENRTELYKQDFTRTELQKSFVNEDEYLSNLGLKIEVIQFDNYSIPRISQLILRSNQFNLRTIRYSENDIKKMAYDPDYLCFAFSVEDKYGKYGLISAVILKKQGVTLTIDTWIMSCRVLNRYVEHYVLNHIVEVALKDNYKNITGEYIPTPKNQLVKDHYKNLGFENRNGLWHLNPRSFSKLNHFFIKKKT